MDKVTNNEPSLREVALQIALSYDGQKEIPSGSNWGKFVQDTLATVGIKFPAAWCMAFVYICYSEAAKQKNVPNPLFKTGGVLAFKNSMTKNYIPKSKLTATSLQRGDLLIYDHGKGNGHIAFVVGDTLSGIETIEGNTNVMLSRNGDGVYRLSRRKFTDTKLIGIVRI